MRSLQFFHLISLSVAVKGFIREVSPSTSVTSTTVLQVASLPKDVKSAVSICRQSVQNALGKRISRMDIEMPVGAKFGVEKQAGKGKKSALSQQDGVSRDTLETSDRELARLFVDMFQPVGGENISVVFREGRQANAAKRKWSGDTTAQCRILSVAKGDQTSGAKKKKKKMGFAAKLAAELDSEVGGPFSLPKGCEVAIFVSPGPKELIAVERISEEVGMGTLIILLNTRLSKMEKISPTFIENYEPVFHLAAAPQDVSPDCLVYRAYPDNWLLARKPKVGQPKVIAEQKSRFLSTECQTAFENMEMDGFEKATEGILDSVADWFR